MLTSPPPQETDPVDESGGRPTDDSRPNEVAPARPTHGRAAAAVIGGCAALGALAAGEFTAAAIDSAPSPVTAIGTEFIDRFAARLKDLAVSLFGTNDKVALVVGIVVVATIIGALLGIARRDTRRWSIPIVGFVAFGALGAWAMATDPQGETAKAIGSAAVAAAVGIAVFVGLWRWTAPAGEPGPVRTVTVSDGSVGERPSIHRRSTFDRRRFVAGVGGLLVASAGAAKLGDVTRQNRALDRVRRSTVLPRPQRSTPPPTSQPFAVDGLAPYVTPVDDFYRIDTALSAPRVDVNNWKLSVGGLVDTPLSFSYDDLLEMDSVEDTVTIACVSNTVGGGLIGNAVWQGVPLAALLDRAGVQSEASQIVGRSVDGFTAGFPLSVGLDGRTALVAYAQNGEPLSTAHGYPARLIIAGLYGYVSATKWLSEIELTTWEDFDGFWVPRGWSKEGPVKVQSRIDVPASGDTVAAGETAIAGVAWHPSVGIERVEVQVDDGDWREAELGNVASDDTWVQWYLPWTAERGDHEIRVRATNADGETQTADEAPPAPNGATGWHTRTVTVA